MYNLKQLILCSIATLLASELIRYLLFRISKRKSEKAFRKAVEQGRVIECNSPEELEALIEKLKKERGDGNED